MNRTLLTTFGLWLAAGVALPARAEAPPRPAPSVFDAFAALPEDAQIGLRLEAALVWADLGATARAIAAERARLGQTRLGASYYAPAAQREAFGFDPLDELTRLVALAAPGGEAVPAALAFFSGPQGPGLQLVAKVAPGFLERFGRALASQAPPAFAAQVTDETITFPLGQNQLVGRVDEGGWLRVAPNAEMLVGGGVPAFTGTLRKWSQDCHTLLVVQGGGMILHDLAGELGNGPLAELLRATRSVAVGWANGAEGTAITRLLVDIPQLTELRSAIRQPDLANSLARVWDDQTSGFFSLSLPPLVTGMIAPMLEQSLAGAETPLPPALVDALGKLDGRLGLVMFDSPDDWAFGVSLRDAASAQAVVPALHAFLDRTMAQLGADAKKTYALEAFPGTSGQVIHMRAHALLEGTRVTSVGNTVIAVRQRARLARLLEQQALPEAERPRVAGPVTKPIRTALDTPAMLLGYLLLGTDGAWLEWAGWMASGAEAAFAKEKPAFPGAELAGRVLAQLPVLLALQGVALSLTYDAAFTADLEASVLILQLLSSEV